MELTSVLSSFNRAAIPRALEAGIGSEETQDFPFRCHVVPMHGLPSVVCPLNLTPLRTYPQLQIMIKNAAEAAGGFQ